MGRPGNKRLQRALYGAAPSSATGSLTTEGKGRYAVTRVTGSVINNGGNMRSGGFPRVGMGLAFLRKTRCNPNCDSFVGTDEDLKTQLDLATSYAYAFSSAAQSAAVLTAATTLIAATAAIPFLVTLAANATAATLASNTPANQLLEADAIKDEADAIKAEATAAADYTAKKAVLDAMDAKNTAAANYVYAQNAITLAAWLAA
tara:strand:+ start:461 stop:1069 length:609 start_codon:yes stop_codon:yes gene_type:complete